MCHQECATVPANPFPEPTNGKAVAMWKHVKDFAVPEASGSTDNATQHAGDNGGGDGRDSPAMAGIAQAAMAAASTANRKTKKPRPHESLVDSLPDPPACGKSDGGCAGGGRGPREEREYSCSSGELESSKPLRLGDTQGGSGDGSGSSNQGMRQESYYLRGAIEADRDRDLLATIADCIPGNMVFDTTLCCNS